MGRAYQKLRADSHASPTYAVRGNPTWTDVERDGGVTRTEFESDANAAYLQALMWIVTQDTRHAQKCVEIFNAWRNLTVMTGGGTAPLNAGLLRLQAGRGRRDHPVDLHRLVGGRRPGVQGDARLPRAVAHRRAGVG